MQCKSGSRSREDEEMAERKEEQGGRRGALEEIGRWNRQKSEEKEMGRGGGRGSGGAAVQVRQKVGKKLKTSLALLVVGF